MKINFEKLYQSNSDPWDFSKSSYELKRYRHIFNAINHKKYQLILEPGCSIGILTSMLSTIAKQVVACDISSTAVNLANNRCKELKNVRIHRANIESIKIDPLTDLIVLSEIGYYFDSMTWKNMVENIIHHCNKGTIILASHWLGQSADHLQHGDGVHQIIESISTLNLEYTKRYIHFRLERWVVI